jgi:ubiquinone biosynthesis protein COQ9
MTGKSRKSSPPRSRNRTTPKDTVLAAALVHVPFDGFTDAVLARAADETRISRAEIKRIFPEGAISLVEAFSEWTDAKMLRELRRNDLTSLKIRQRISLAVETRLSVLKPHKESARRAAAFLTLPPHAATGAKLLYRTVDAIWRACGDASTDFNFYTKRAILAGVYSATLMRWFADSDVREQETREFLRRRIEEVMTFEKVKAQIRERIGALPSLSDILNLDRRGPTAKGS